MGYISMKVKVAQSCLTLCDPVDYTVHGILQARILEWVAVPFSRGSSQPRSPTLQAILYQLSHRGSHQGRYISISMTIILFSTTF